MNAMTDLLSQARLYCVLDAQVAGYDQLFEILERSAGCGVDIFQIRDKQGSDRDIMEFTRRAVKYLNGKALFIVNDRVDLALNAQADGVHIGQHDDALKDVRCAAGSDLIVGVSCQTIPQAREAWSRGADYIGFGSVFKTQTKPGRDPMNLEMLAGVLQEAPVPVFAIGGITAERCDLLKRYGVTRVAVTRAVCCADDVCAAARTLKEKFTRD